MILNNRTLTLEPGDKGTFTFYGHDSISGGDTTLSFTCNIPDVFRFIDLGLPSGTKWANWNIGATSATTLGDYYSFGETYHKTSYGMRNYPNTPLNKWVGVGGGTPAYSTTGVDYTYYNGTKPDLIDIVGVTVDDTNYPKYTDNVSAVEALLTNNVLKSENDVASLSYTGSQLPTKEDVEELIEYTDQSIIKDGVITFVSKINGKSIQFPVGGIFNGPSQIYGIDDNLNIPSAYPDATKQPSSDNLKGIIGTATYIGGANIQYSIFVTNGITTSVSSYGVSGGLQLRAVKKS